MEPRLYILHGDCSHDQ